MLKRFIALLLTLLVFASTLCFYVNAKEADYKNTAYSAGGFANTDALFDTDRTTYETASGDAYVSVSRDDGIAHLYIEFDRVPSVWTLEDVSGGKRVECGKNAFLHEYVDLTEIFGYAPEELKLIFPEGTVIADIYAFSDGALPSLVQKWEPILEEADLMFISTHSDDEQLFFSGALPYYAIERDIDVQIVYAVQHFQRGDTLEHRRPHEQLDGLWTVGIRNYPVISDIPDVYAESKDRNTAYSTMEANFQKYGVSITDFERYITECLRRCKPLVVVSHDLNGEYGHGAHIFVAESLTRAIDLASDPDAFPESAKEYGTWSPEKTYLHLYEENAVRLDWDTPYESMGGKTPFQVSQDGFRCHVSQKKSRFFKWIYGDEENPVTKASQIEIYSPCEFGLFDTKVGADEKKNDFMENIKTYAERHRLAELEAEASRADEESRLEASRLDEESVLSDNSVKADADMTEGSRKWLYIALLAVAIVGIIAVFSAKSNKK